MAQYFLINGYFKDDETPFEGYIVTDTQGEVAELDNKIFFYGLSETLIQDAINLGDKTAHDFVITSYEPTTLNNLPQTEMKTEKETRVFVCDLDLIQHIVGVNAESISKWTGEEDEAKEFIKASEFNGTIYSLEGFQNALNYDEIDQHGLFIFITNKY